MVGEYVKNCCLYSAHKLCQITWHSGLLAQLEQHIIVGICCLSRSDQKGHQLQLICCTLQQSHVPGISEGGPEGFCLRWRSRSKVGWKQSAESMWTRKLTVGDPSKIRPYSSLTGLLISLFSLTAFSSIKPKNKRKAE